eukprot:TCONS_00047526-protein
MLRRTTQRLLEHFEVATKAGCIRNFHMSPDGEPDRGPLDGVRVLDMSRVLAGPYCTQLLGDMGAEVIKIERPGSGDDTRAWGPPFVGGESCYYLSINRNKRSIVVDVKTEDGKQIIYDLAKRSDVFVENFQRGKIEKMGFGYEKLKTLNKRLVYASISGFGAHGPDHEKPGYDMVASAVGGLMSITGPAEGRPAVAGASITDIMSGMYANGAICAALYERRSTNRGKRIHCSLLQTQVAYLCHIAANYLNTGVVGKRHGSAHGSIVPYQAFETGDDHEIVVAGANDKFFKIMCEVLGLSELVEDSRFHTNAKRVINREELIPLLQAKLKEQPSLYWIEHFQRAGVPCGRVNNMDDVFDMPQVKALGIVQSIPHPTAGRIKVPGPAVEYDGISQLALARHPPLMGEHTIEILKDVLHYEETKIEELLTNNVVMEGGAHKHIKAHKYVY